MSVRTETKRTLVKSPPELWSEISDSESLARHLGGVQDVRITRVEPETAVEWEADGASGSVRLQPSGFGTKVTLSLSRELPPTEPVAAEQEPASEPAPQPESPVVEPESEPEPEPVAELEPEPAGEPDPQPDLVASEPTPETSMPEPVIERAREGFFARLFKRRRKPVASAEGSIDPPREPQPIALDTAEREPMSAVELEPALPVGEREATSEPDPEAISQSLTAPTSAIAETEQAISPEADPAPEPSQPMTSVTADLAILEAEMAEQDEAMLTAMLDRLGAAHHRPFSRS